MIPHHHLHPKIIIIFQLIVVFAISSSAPTTLIDSSGILNRALSSSTSAPSNGILTILNSPSTTSSHFPASSTLQCEESESTLILTSPGATLSSSTNPISQGKSGGAAACVSGSVVVTGITANDAMDLANTRHGRTLTSVFGARLLSEEERQKTLLVLAVEGDEELDEEKVLADVSRLFETCALSRSDDDSTKFGDLYEVKIMRVCNEEDANRILQMAKEYSSRGPLSENTPIFPSLSEIYNNLLSKSTTTTDTPSTLSLKLLCEDSFSRQSKSSRAKLTSWKNRVQRGLLIEKFGFMATVLLKRCLDQYDRDTFLASGGGAASFRFDLRSKLKENMEKTIGDLFSQQVTTLEKTTLKGFKEELLKFSRRSGSGVNYDDNAAALRAASFSFDETMSELEIVQLGLTKTTLSQEMLSKLDEALLSFPESPAAKFHEMRSIKKKAAKQKQKPKDKSIDIGVNLVAMVRPDGFGNLQGFAGYTMGSNGITVGVHNDADAPETLSQFGGTRPPFLRVQPKLNFDVEL